MRARVSTGSNLRARSAGERSGWYLAPTGVWRRLSASAFTAQNRTEPEREKQKIFNGKKIRYIWRLRAFTELFCRKRRRNYHRRCRNAFLPLSRAQGRQYRCTVSVLWLPAPFPSTLQSDVFTRILAFFEMHF